MLVKFKVENWKSFHCLDFSAIASQEKRFLFRIPELKDYPARLLPVTAIFGGNASGKTNFFDALKFLQQLVRGQVVVRNRIDVKPFALNKEQRKKPVAFEIDFFIEPKVYHYELKVSNEEIIFERLAEIDSDGYLTDYFVRNRREIELFGEYKTERLEYVGKGTRNTVLFLTNSFQQQCEEFSSIYRWFDETLLLISPNWRPKLSPDLLQSECSELLDLFDVGFDKLDKIDVPLEQMMTVMSSVSRGGQFFRLKSLLGDVEEQGDVKMYQLVAMHTSEDGTEEIPFNLEDESEGTRRLLELTPVLNRLRNASQPRVVFIDEIDRSMHHLLTKKLIETYLDECSPESRTQLFFTTHDALLLDDDLMRHDEMWLVEREDRVSQLRSIADFKMRKGQNLLFSYLYGCFGGIPHIH